MKLFFNGLLEFISMSWFFFITRESFYEQDVFTDMGLVKPSTSVPAADLEARKPTDATEDKQEPKKEDDPKPDDIKQVDEAKKKEEAERVEKESADTKSDDTPELNIINGKEVSDEDLAGFVAEAKKDFDDEEWDKLSPKAQYNLVTKLVNLKEASKAANIRSDKIAENRKENEKKELELSQKEADLTAEKNRIAQLNAEVENKKKELDRRETEIENKKKELKETIEKKPTNEYDDDEKVDLKVEQKLAKKELKDLEDESKKNQSAYKEVVERSKIEAEGQQRLMDAKKLIASVPELAVKGDILKMLTQYKDGTYDGDYGDLQRALAVQKIVVGYWDDGTKMDITKYYDLNKYIFNVPKIESAQPDKEVKKIEIKTADDFAKKVKSLFAKQQKNPGAGGPGGAGGGTQVKLDDAEAKNQKELKELSDLGLGFGAHHEHDPATVEKVRK